jgi:hypothetical protein
MKAYKTFLKEKYKKIKFKITKTQHLLIAKINGVSGNFILDTGASNSCVGFESIELFLLSRSKASGSHRMFTKLHQIISYNLEFGRFIIRFSDFDLSHVNEALIQHKSKPVHGIIGTYY